MKYISLPDDSVRRLSFFLAMEEHVARRFAGEDCFFMWQVNPSIIIGRNQLIENEINLDYAAEQGIALYRRKSGGGCVYADFSNIMFSHVTDDFNVGFTFDRYLRLITHTLGKLGLRAAYSGRNDITIDGRKVSGNAFYRTNGRSIVHGTMLFDTDLERLVRVLTPNHEKLISKGVESVRKRVTNLKEHIDLDIEAFKQFMRTSLCHSEAMLTAEDVRAIEEIEQGYLADEWIRGNNPRYTCIRKGYGEAGEVEVRLEIKNGVIKAMNLMGDYFVVGEPDEFLSHFKNRPFTREAVEEVLSQHPIEQCIRNLSREAFTALLFNEPIP